MISLMATHHHRPRLAVSGHHRIDFLVLLLLSTSLYLSSFSFAITDDESSAIHRALHEEDSDGGELPDDYEAKVNIPFEFPNRRLRRAYIALQAWKNAIYSDPNSMTKNWKGPDVCNYNGVFCAPALDNPNTTVVAGIDLNHADIAGYLPAELGLLTDIALLHLNSNRFCGIVPRSFSKLQLLFELDLSNNRFVGPFPEVVLDLEELKFLDLRFNDFEGQIPPEIFQKGIDALFVNSNRFTSKLPTTFKDSRASVMVFANNKFEGCASTLFADLPPTLNEIVLQGNNLQGCLPEDIGSMLHNITYLDISCNSLTGPIPSSLLKMKNVSSINLSHNKFTGSVPEDICSMPQLANFVVEDNYLDKVPDDCFERKDGFSFSDEKNCMSDRPNPRSTDECTVFMKKPIDCMEKQCGVQAPPKPKPKPPPTPVPSPPPPVFSPPPPVYPPPPPPAPVLSPPPPVHSPPPPAPKLSPPPAPKLSPPPPPPPAKQDVVLPPDMGMDYKSPPPPAFPGY